MKILNQYKTIIMTKFVFHHSVLYLLPTLLLLAGCRQKEAQTQQPIQKISVAYPEVKPITLHKKYPGYLSSEQTVNLVARVNGYLQKIAYEPGNVVPAGTLLFVIEPTLYQESVNQSEAAVKSAEAKLDYAQNNYTRMKEAAQEDAISEIDLIQSRTNVEAAQAALKEARAQLATARTNLSYCYVKAPYRGRVSRSQYDVGNYINGSLQATTLATLYQDDKMYAYFNIEDNQYLKMMMASPEKVSEGRLPKEITLTFQQPLAKEYVGKLDYLSPNIQLSTGTMTLRAQVDNPEGELKSGLYVTISLPYGKNDSAVMVKDASIGTDQLGKYLYLVNDSNKVVYRHIEVGELVADTLREVTSGLTGNDRYVTKALLKVREGMTVDPVIDK